MLGGPFGSGPDAFAYVALLVVALVLWRTTWRGRRLPGVSGVGPMLVGHRGTRGVEPENTLAAFKRAFDDGLDGVEFDVQRSLDGVLVLTHDDDIGGRAVAGQSYAELAERIPGLATLAELFELARQYPGRLLNLEVKASSWRTAGLEREVVRAIRASGLADRVLVSSFNPLSLVRVRLRAPSLRVAWLYYVSAATRRAGRPHPGWLHADAVHPHYKLVDVGLVGAMHARGVAVNVWTVNDVQDVRAMCELGVDAIMGDDPARLKSALGG